MVPRLSLRGSPTELRPPRWSCSTPRVGWSTRHRARPGRWWRPWPPRSSGCARGQRSHSSAAFDHEERHVVLQPLAAAGRVRGLPGGGPTGDRFTVPDLQLIDVGVALVGLATRATSRHRHRSSRPAGSPSLRSWPTDSPATTLPMAAVGWDELIAGPIRVLVAEGPGARLLELLEAVEDSAADRRVEGRRARRGPPCRAGRLGDTRRAQGGPPHSTHRCRPGGRGRVAGPDLAWGVSDVVVADHGLADGLRQARRALAASGARRGAGRSASWREAAWSA